MHNPSFIFGFYSWSNLASGVWHQTKEWWKVFPGLLANCWSRKFDRTVFYLNCYFNPRKYFDLILMMKNKRWSFFIFEFHCDACSSFRIFILCTILEALDLINIKFHVILSNDFRWTWDYQFYLFLHWTVHYNWSKKHYKILIWVNV